jgi:hypothetical protein
MLRRLSSAALRAASRARAPPLVPRLQASVTSALPPTSTLQPSALRAWRGRALSGGQCLGFASTACCGRPCPRRAAALLSTHAAAGAAAPGASPPGAAGDSTLPPPPPPTALPPPHAAALHPPSSGVAWLQALQVDAACPGKAILTAIPRRALCAETGLALRDLRVVDPSFRGQLPAVLVRRGAIVVALEHVKAVITAQRVLLFDAGNPRCGLLTHVLSARAHADLKAETRTLAPPFVAWPDVAAASSSSCRTSCAR